MKKGKKNVEVSVNDGVKTRDYVIFWKGNFYFSAHPRASAGKASNAKANNKATNLNHKNISLSRARISKTAVLRKEIEQAEISLGFARSLEN